MDQTKPLRQYERGNDEYFDGEINFVFNRLELCAGKSPKSTILTLTVLESCVKNCRREFLELVCTREFSEFLISRVISPHLDPGPEVQSKVLSLLQSWAHAFSPDPHLQGWYPPVLTHLKIHPMQVLQRFILT